MLAPSEHNHCLSTGMCASALPSSSLSRRRHFLAIGAQSVSYQNVAGNGCGEMSCCATSLDRATHGRNMSSQSGAPGVDAMNLLWSLPILTVPFRVVWNNQKRGRLVSGAGAFYCGERDEDQRRFCSST